ncbi:MAG TPA: hypothetical protein VMU29_12020 [Smithella sp.]|nr:hypothetical protein [Smithella sp.]
MNDFTKGGVLHTIQTSLHSGAEQGISMGVQHYLTNKIAAGTYDPEREPFDQLLQSVGSGVFVGMVLPGVLAAVQHAPKEVQDKTKEIINQDLKKYTPGPESESILTKQYETPRQTEREPSEPAGTQPSPVENVPEKPADQIPVPQTDFPPVGTKVNFDWLGEPKTGEVVEHLKDRYRVQDDAGTVYPIKQSSPIEQKQAITIPKFTFDQIKEEPAKEMASALKKGNKVVAMSINPVSWIRPVRQGMNLLQDATFGNLVDRIEDWVGAKVKQGLVHNNVVIRNASNMAQSLMGGIAYQAGDIKNKLNFIGNKNYGNLKAKILSQDLYKIIDSSQESLLLVHQALDPETYVNQTQEGTVHLGAQDRIKKKLAGKQGALTKKLKEDPSDIVAIDQLENDIANLHDDWNAIEGEKKALQDRLQQSALSRLNEQEKALHDHLKLMNQQVHQWHYDNGLIPKSVYDKYNGKYIARLYEQFEVPEDIEKAFQSTRPDFDIFKARKDFNTVNQALIRDPVFATSKRVGQMLQTQAIFEYADALNKSGIETRTEETPGFTQLGTPGSKPYYGSLTGKFVPNYVAQDFKGFFFANKFLDWTYRGFRGYDQSIARQFLKRFHTVYSPVVHIGNTMSNFAFGAMSGIDPLTFTMNQIRARKEIKSQSPLYQSLVKSGLLGTDVITTDFKTSKESESGGLLSKALNTYKKFSEKASGFYGAADDYAKTAAYISFVEDGYTHDQAIRKVYEGFQNYATVGKLYDVASKTPVIGNPYIKFKADLARIIKNGVAKRPLTMAAFLGSLYLTKNFLSKESDESDIVREIRERRPFTPFIPTPGGKLSLNWQVPKVGEVNFARFISPFYVYDKGDKNDMLNDVTGWLPYQFDETNDSPSKDLKTFIPEMNDVLLGPWVSAVLWDHDFRGKSIRDPQGNDYITRDQSASDQVLNALTFISRSQIPFFSSAQDMISAYNGEADYYGRERKISQSILNNLIKVQEFTDKQAVETLSKEIRYKVAKFEGYSRDVSTIRNDAEKRIAKIMASQMASDDQKKQQIQEEINHLSKALSIKLNQQVDVIKDLQDPVKLLNNLNHATTERKK